MRSQNSVQTPRITHACRLVAPQDGKSEAASSPPSNHISNSNEAELQMLLVRRHLLGTSQNGESEIYAIVCRPRKNYRVPPSYAPDSSTLCNQYHLSTCTSLTDRESPSPNNLDDDNPHLPLSTFLLPHSIISSLLQHHRHLKRPSGGPQQ